MSKFYVYVMETMADWEIANITAEVKTRRYFKKDEKKIELYYVAEKKEVVHSMGGLAIVPDCTVDEIEVESENFLLLPGSNTWHLESNKKILGKAVEFLDHGAGVAAICGATVALANLGILDERKHTSNGIGFLDYMSPSYKGKENYVAESAVMDGNLITASATGSLQMARLILNYLDVMKKEKLEAWYDYFSTGNPASFFALMEN